MGAKKATHEGDFPSLCAFILSQTPGGVEWFGFVATFFSPRR